MMILALLAPLARVAGAGDPTSVFHIDRSKNRNQVHYALQVEEECTPAASDPVYPYWLRLEEDPVETRHIKWYQEPAYGVRSQEVDGREVRVRLRAIPERELVVRLAPADDDCRADAFMTIDGAEARLASVYVASKEGLFLPKVVYIDLIGERPDGESVRERIVPD